MFYGRICCDGDGDRCWVDRHAILLCIDIRTNYNTTLSDFNFMINMMGSLLRNKTKNIYSVLNMNY